MGEKWSLLSTGGRKIQHKFGGLTKLVKSRFWVMVVWLWVTDCLLGCDLFAEHRLVGWCFYINLSFAYETCLV